MNRKRTRPSAVAVLAAAVLVVLGQLPAAASAGLASTRPLTDDPGMRGAGHRADALLVRVRPDASEAHFAAALAAMGASEIGRLDALHTRVVVPTGGRERAALKQALRANADVLSVEDDGGGQLAFTPNDPHWSKEWFARKVNAPRAWDLTVGTDTPIIAILDTGVSAGHNDFRGRVMEGRDFVNDDRNASDDNGHGTMVAGIAAAKGNNSIGVAGTCWKCRILPVKVINRHGAVRWSNAAAGIIWATDHGADVINMSFGDHGGNSTLARGVRYAVERGVVVIGAAGNDGRTAAFYPAAYPGVMAVAATTSSDTLYWWSNRGSWVDVAAPGCAWTTLRGDRYGSFCGTSAAAPIVAGVAGLLLSMRPGASASAVKSAIRSTTVRFTWRIDGGRVDAWEALKTFR